MTNLKPYELFYRKGFDAFKEKDYLLAEKCFLASLFECSKNQQAYYTLLPSANLELLSMRLYSKGYFENKERALEFFKVFSGVEEYVASGYAIALINGVFGNPDYNEAIKQLSRAHYDAQLYLLAYLLHEGKGLEKDSAKAALFLKSSGLIGAMYFSQSAEQLYDSISKEIEIVDDELNKYNDSIAALKKAVKKEEEISEQVKEIFKEKTLKFDNNITVMDVALAEFFKKKNNIPDIQIDTNGEIIMEKRDSDFEYQVRNLKEIFNAAYMSPVFKENPKYCTGQFENITPYISYDDVRNYKYIIRARPIDENNLFDSEEREIIVRYDSIEQLVKDGWRLD